MDCGLFFEGEFAFSISTTHLTIYQYDCERQMFCVIEHYSQLSNVPRKYWHILPSQVIHRHGKDKDLVENDKEMEMDIASCFASIAID